MDKRLLERASKQVWFHRYPRALPIAMFVLVCLVTAMIVAAIEVNAARDRARELATTTQSIVTALQRRMSDSGLLLRAASSTFENGKPISRAAFSSLAADLQEGQQDSGGLGLGWGQRVAGEAIAQLIRQQRLGGHEDFAIWPTTPAKGAIAVPVVFLAPVTPANRAAIGFDMYGEPVRRQAMDLAARLHKPVVTGLIHLMQDRQHPGAAGFVLFMPVFRDGVLQGFVCRPFRADEFFISAVQRTNLKGVNVAIFDGVPAPANLLAAQRSAGRAGVELTRRFTVANRDWTVTVSMVSPGFFSQLSQFAIAFGGMLAALLLYITRLIIRRAELDREALQWQTRQVSIRTTLSRELNHRVKNSLANVLSIAALTRRRTNGLDEFYESFTGRVRALSATHDLLTMSEWSKTHIGDIVRSELAPYIHDNEGNVVIQGPEIAVAAHDALSLGLAVHELVTNAAKYGALSSVTGKVSVTWHLVTPVLAAIDWREAGGPVVAAPDKRGFGRDLLERIVAKELEQEVRLDFAPDGLRCRIFVPIRELPPFSLRSNSED